MARPRPTCELLLLIHPTSSYSCSCALTFRQNDVQVINCLLVCRTNTVIESCVHGVIDREAQRPVCVYILCDVYRRSNVVPFYTVGLPSMVTVLSRQTADRGNTITILYNVGIVSACG